MPFDVLKSGDFKKAKLVAGQILETNYLYVKAHIAAVRAADELGDTATAAHHRYVAQGVIDSILKSGDGKTFETAYKVIAVDEEYALVQSQGLRVTEQALLREGEHSYDVLTVLDPKTQTAWEVFFNIDPIMRSLDKKFSP